MSPEPQVQKELPHGRYLTFGLGDEQYGVPIEEVREIMPLIDVTRVPGTPSCLRGVANLRGKIIPVMDVRCRFDLDPVPATEETCIIVVMLYGLLRGLIVDRVCEVVTIGVDEIDARDEFGDRFQTHCLLGVGRGQGGVQLLLDLKELLDWGELSEHEDGQRRLSAAQ